ncbi:MAG TPA: 2-amino-4-hydroxy-6-hydroxymethyldihydropteridine diphosphokinase [Bacteroidales bacterium]|nr:2-amino-4-hydroxy-6-hydroxymethyldihydropteridine diphosphokinase [Bacteroidales bacterium]
MNHFQLLLASNINSEENMLHAMENLKTIFPSGIRFSSILSSKAVNKEGKEVPGSSPYLNAICQASTEFPMDQVRFILKDMENQMGRKRGTESKGMVTIDLDLVLWNDEILRPWDLAQVFYQNCLKSL